MRMGFAGTNANAPNPPIFVGAIHESPVWHGTVLTLQKEKSILL